MTLALPLALFACAYLAAAHAAPHWRALRTLAFLAGLFVIAVALGPLADPADERLSAHMVQHMLLSLVAPPLVLAGAPLRLALTVLPRQPRRRLAALLRSSAARLLTHPATGVVAFSAVMVGTHVPAFYDAALASAPLHGLEHALWFWSAVLFWIPVLAVQPLPHAPSPVVRILMILLAMPAMTLVGAGLVLAEDGVYSAYAGGAFDQLADQRAGGRIMWLVGTPFMAAALLAIGWSALLREERQAAARDALEAVR